MRTRAAIGLLLCLRLAPAQGWADRSSWNGPTPRSNHALVYDAAHGYVILYGGASPYVPGLRLNDTWTWDGAAWTQQTPANVPAQQIGSEPRNAAMAFHAATAEVVLVASNLSYTWTGADWLARGPVPSLAADCVPSMAYDAIHAETVLHDANAAQPVVYLWNGASWAARQPLTWPGMLNYWTDYAPYMTTDPGTGRPFLAGWNGSTPACWEWSGMLWQQQQPNVPNNGVLFGALSGDTAHARIVMFDVHWLEYPAQPDHTWTLAGSTLERLTTPLGPNPRLRTAMAFDSARGVTVLFGGFLPGTPGTGFPLGDTWEFALGDGPAFSTYGIGCAGSSGRPTVAAQGGAVPRIGQPFALQISNLPLTGPAFLFLGLSDQSYLGHPLPLDLGFLGAPGCPLLCSAESLQVLTNVLGSSVWTFAVPPFPGAVFFNQAVAFDPAANALGLTTSNGGRSVIGM